METTSPPIACRVHEVDTEAMGTIQIRDVPDSVAERLKVRASAQNRSLSEYLRVELERLAEQATLEEILEEVEREGRRDQHLEVAELLRDERERRTWPV